jgi:hypothetical protein
MTPQESVPTLQATAAMLLPGMKHARSLLDVSIRVLQYFESNAARDLCHRHGDHLAKGGAEPHQRGGASEGDALRIRAVARLESLTRATDPCALAGMLGAGKGVSWDTAAMGAATIE